MANLKILQNAAALDLDCICQNCRWQHSYHLQNNKLNTKLKNTY